MSDGKVALVFGASGISGWAFVNQCLEDYPHKGVWNGVVALTNRPLSREQSSWPDDGRLDIVSGIDLLEGSQQDVEGKLVANVPKLDQITHVVYMAYKFSADTSVEIKENVEMLKRVVTAADRLCPRLEFVINQTGSKAYGCHLLRNRPAYLVPPFVEDRDKLGQPEAEDLFYFPQLAWLTEFARDRPWSWCETRPDVIVGFVPNFNFYSLASALGFYLSLFREINGDGAECAFPGNSATWVAKSQDSSADMIARQTIHVALASGTKKGQAFNVADHRGPRCWREKWPIICGFFGLKGVKIEQEDPVDIRQYIKQNYAIWEGMERKYGLQRGHADNPKVLAGHESFLLSQFGVDRQFDMTRMYDEAGFKEERSVAEGWGPVFERMRKAKLIPVEFK